MSKYFHAEERSKGASTGRENPESFFWDTAKIFIGLEFIHAKKKKRDYVYKKKKQKKKLNSKRKFKEKIEHRRTFIEHESLRHEDKCAALYLCQTSQRVQRVHCLDDALGERLCWGYQKRF